MQAIRTAYHGPTNTRGARIHAMCTTGHLTMSYDHELDQFGNHRAACQQLLLRLGWTKVNGYPHLYGGSWAGDMMWVFARDEDRVSA